MKFKFFTASFLIGSLFLGCATQNQQFQTSVNNSKQSQKVINNTKNDNVCFLKNGFSKCILRIEASGIGVVPCNGSCSVPQAKAMARRAAIVSAYRNLAEKLYGIKINGRDSVKNMILQSSTVRTYVNGIIRGATIEDESFKNGTYSVVLSLKLDPKKWNIVLREAGLM